MNFKGEKSPLNMPELEWYYGYPFAIGLMIAVALGIVLFFRKKGYIGGDRQDREERALEEHLEKKAKKSKLRAWRKRAD